MNVKRTHGGHGSSKKFAFKLNDFVPLEDREYGLINTSGDKASTPHPKKWKTNLNALNARLEEMKSRYRSKESDDKSMSLFTNGILSPPPENSVDKEFLGISAPTPFRGRKKGSIKKVVLLSPRKTEKVPFKVMLPQTDPPSFHERRRLFHEAEFTIAKHGKKMNDFFIGANDENTDDDWSELDAYATLQLETLTAEHGLVHSALGVLTFERPLKSPSTYEIK